MVSAMKFGSLVQTTEASCQWTAANVVVRRKCPCCSGGGLTGNTEQGRNKELTSRRASLFPHHTGKGSAADPSETVHETLRSPGQPLHAVSRAFMESRSGHDFGHVRVHTDAKAAESAEAVGDELSTLEQHIFGLDPHVPTTRRGRHLLAHELVHLAADGRPTRISNRSDVAGTLRRATPRPRTSSPGAGKDWYMLRPPPQICQSGCDCWAASAAAWLRVTNMNPDVTRDQMLIKYGKYCDDEGCLLEKYLRRVYADVNAVLVRAPEKFDYEYAVSRLKRYGHLLLLVDIGGVGHALIVYGVGFGPDGRPSKTHFSAFDPLDCTYQNRAFDSVKPTYVARRNI